MTKLTDLFGDAGCGCTDDYALETEIALGYVRTQRHPTQPLTIYNYTPKTQFEKRWNRITKQCRGLIVHDDGTVVARPFAKFFNWGEVSAEDFDMGALVTVSDKADGSLGILYPTPGIGTGWAIATRGSFTSEQAEQATKMLWTDYADWTPSQRMVDEGITVLFEIIYPENRIVLDYAGKRELRLIDAVWIDRGWSIGSNSEIVADYLKWDGPVVQHLSTDTLDRVLADLPAQRPNAEGVVLRFLNTDDRYKIKQADYVALHRVLTGTSARTIWTYMAVNACHDHIEQAKHWGSRLGIDPKRAEEILAVGDDWQNRMLSNVPDEFYDWVRQTIARIQTQAIRVQLALANLVLDAKRQVMLIEQTERAGIRQRMYHTLRAMSPEHHGAAMALWDGKDVTTYCWKSVYPGVENPFMTQTEDVA